VVFERLAQRRKAGLEPSSRFPEVIGVPEACGQERQLSATDAGSQRPDELVDVGHAVPLVVVVRGLAAEAPEFREDGSRLQSVAMCDKEDAGGRLGCRQRVKGLTDAASAC
jgi:hypothetical protein